MMTYMLQRSKQKGFTIVELLIVVVVIAILAAITIVSYNGITNKANDTAIQSDLKNIGNILEQHRVLNDEYPATLTASLGIKASRGAYKEDAQNTTLRYCRNSATNQFIMYATSKSNQYFKYISGQGVTSAIATYGYAVCSQIGLSTTNPSDNGLINGVWSSWVN